jgi:tRNA U34 5-methylaminomethyl-2-thiouridine-forming methyltransferase MnmC
MNPSYKLVTLTNGIVSLCETENEETFHPGIGPEAEADTLYVAQLKIAERMSACGDEFVVWDVGLGAAANAIGALKAIRECRGKLRLVSFDCTDGALRFALANAAALGYVEGYEEIIKQLLNERMVSFRCGSAEVEWEFHLADFPAFLADGTAAKKNIPAPHAVMFDAYSPSTNPSMWTLPLFSSLYNAISPERPCSLSTYSRSTMLRVSLMLAGFYVGSGEPTGQKDETTIAANRPDLIARPLARKWLERVRISTGAEPLHENSYRQAPITDESWERLIAHPQWI